jgi:alanine racemase
MTPKTPPPEATGIITIDLARLRANWRALADLVAPAECGAVVKADAYGLGANRVIPALHAAGCRTFFIATADEARTARRLAPDARLYALDGLLPASADALQASRTLPVLSGTAEVREWAQAARTQSTKLPAALHIDTGLNRLGLSENDIDELLEGSWLLEAVDIRLVMSHLACADDPSDPKNQQQRRTFEHLRARLPSAPASLAASDGLMLGRAYHYDLVRPGYALYGGQAFRGGSTPVAPVVSVQARILEIRDVPPGGTVGYSATWRAVRPSRVAIVAAGYADGVPRMLSATGDVPHGAVGIGNERAPIIGRVSMDLITVDVTEVKAQVARGDFVDLVGNGLTLEVMGAAAGTIGYEILTRLGPRFHRTYVDEAP